MDVAELRALFIAKPGAEPSRPFGPGYHLNKRHWITVTADGTADAEIPDWIDDSYDLVVAALPRRVREGLTAP